MMSEELKDSKDWGSEIGKIKKGDKVLVSIISEPLQEQYNRVLEKREEFSERYEKAKALYSTPDKMSMEEAREMILLKHEEENLSREFWITVNEQYKLWKIGAIGIRNGYCLVKTLGPQDLMERFKKVMDDFMEEVNGDDQ